MPSNASICLFKRFLSLLNSLYCFVYVRGS
nr:MAG TPA: hypothetical protein [Caudoviricetes sp.]